MFLLRLLVLTLFGTSFFLQAPTAPAKRARQRRNPARVWTDPNDRSMLPDFAIQGEYVGKSEQGEVLGCQIIALGDGAFQAVMLPGGLPGDGWDGKNKSLMDGKLEGTEAVFEPAKGTKRYLAQAPAAFAATAAFPPPGQKDYAGRVRGDTLAGKNFELKKVFRRSPSIGAKPPAGALVLFDGTSAVEWTGGRIDKEHGILNTDGADILTKRKFNNYQLHVEFLLPFRPEARGQGRGNSGVYQVDHYEVQVLDSFGLEGKDNECSGIYTKAAPKVNLCFPPLVWQTYDIEFTNAVRDEGKKVKNARITVKHNGVLVHDKTEISGPTGGHRSDPEGTPGPIKLQGHGNPLQFRNIWIVEKT